MAVAPALSGIPSELALEARLARRRRFSALILDLIFFWVLSLVINNVYGITQVTSGAPLAPGRTFAYYTTITTVAWPVLTLLWLAYYTVPEALFGASLGKILCGLCVVRVDGRPLGMGSVLTRNVLRLVDVLPGFYLLGGLFVLGTLNSQRIGDKWAGTTLVRRDETLAVDPLATRRPPAGARRALGIVLLVALVFTIAFDYFGRPPLVIEGLFNEHRLLSNDVTAYRLGSPQWEFGRVSYPIDAVVGGKMCSGSITLEWFVLGWDENQAQWSCSS